MPNATVQANAPASPEATDRRGFLRSLVTASAGIAASAPLALISSPATASPGEEERELFDLCHRAGQLLDEHVQAAADLKSARARLRERAPLPPRPRKKPDKLNFFKIVRNPVPFGSSKPIECSVDQVYEHLFERTRGENFESARKIYDISDRYAGKLYEAAAESGYSAARARFHRLNNEIAELTKKAFELKPQTNWGLAAQSAVLLVSLAASGAREDPAQQLATNALDIFVKQSREVRT